MPQALYSLEELSFAKQQSFFFFFFKHFPDYGERAEEEMRSRCVVPKWPLT